MCIHICVYICIYDHVCIYIYIYILGFSSNMFSLQESGTLLGFFMGLYLASYRGPNPKASLLHYPPLYWCKQQRQTYFCANSGTISGIQIPSGLSGYLTTVGAEKIVKYTDGKKAKCCNLHHLAPFGACLLHSFLGRENGQVTRTQTTQVCPYFGLVGLSRIHPKRI